MFEKLKIIWAGMKLGKFFSHLKTKPPENDMSTKGGDYTLTNSSNNTLEQNLENNSTNTVVEGNNNVTINVTIEQLALHVNGDPRPFVVRDQTKRDLKAIDGNDAPPSVKMPKKTSYAKKDSSD